MQELVSVFEVPAKYRVVTFERPSGLLSAVACSNLGNKGFSTISNTPGESVAQSTVVE